MTAVRSRLVALLASLVIVGAAGWSLSLPYLLRSYLVQTGLTIIDVFGARETPVGWFDLEAGTFRLKVPLGTKIDAERNPRFGAGRIVHPTFALAYHFGPGTDDQRALKTAADYREEAFAVKGHAALLRWATVRGSNEPYRLALYVEKAGRWHGAPVALELHGCFASEYQRDLAVTVLKSITLEDLPDSLAAIYPEVIDYASIIVP